MKVFTAAQIRQCDASTIQHEPVGEVDLMERAATACADWISARFTGNEKFCIFCGNGNNGGDGFALARILADRCRNVIVFGDFAADLSDSASHHLKRLKAVEGVAFLDIKEAETFQFSETSVIIDALLGTGLNRKIEGWLATVIEKLNAAQVPKISVDIPSGLLADQLVSHSAVIFKADYTLTFQFWRRSFLHFESGKFCGEVHLLDIGLSAEFINKEKTPYFTIDEDLIQKIYRKRDDFSHKGTFGKTLIAAGSFGKMGAAVLATKAALKTGSGLTVTLAPTCGYEILQISCPEAMFVSGGKTELTEFFVEENAAAGIGPGLGTSEKTVAAFLSFLKTYEKPLVIDADALNIIAENPEYLKAVPKDSIITPHPKEFQRLFGETANSFERLELARQKACELAIYIVLKDHHTQVVTPEMKVYYNTTGNSGMAKGGSGDALLGVITSLLAQDYSPRDAALFGVWLHGAAGDLAAEKFSKEAMLPGDLINELGNVFKYLSKKIPFNK
ncbi:bifunctional ADP-dependent NAD(P)H-hydrate dehydratase/NAD(P)H-hydrate epimerase [Kaistella palustris]|uniref:bifunctional ADP-dependent NAD(P)H-hydrate dehydratase/NAD(P)H-hydrate epimerase n=1 Tax=Kaistella palustris TaxID=493376 RepID=UPI00041AE32C|nr:bifunctional ADP-dependent NAD(P)H-hydrate dehydratase/NAD(P)H-hydrate epimerase [Kaistella palustris]